MIGLAAKKNLFFLTTVTAPPITSLRKWTATNVNMTFQTRKLRLQLAKTCNKAASIKLTQWFLNYDLKSHNRK